MSTSCLISIDVSEDRECSIFSFESVWEVISVTMQNISEKYLLKPNMQYANQSTIIGAVRGTYSQLWVTIIPVSSPHAPCKYDKRFCTPAKVWFTGRN